jgi:hypothetical protein
VALQTRTIAIVASGMTFTILTAVLGGVLLTARLWSA